MLSSFAEQFGDEIVAADDIAVDDSWGIVVGRTGAFQTFRFMPHRTASEGFFAAVARKAFDASAPIVVPRPRKRIFAEVAASDGRELARWVREPRLMKFASAGDVLYGCAASRYDDIRLLAQTLTVIYSGVAMGQIFKGTLKPDWALSQYIGLNREAVASTEVDETVALDYMRKRDVKAETFVEGMNLVVYDGLPLGFLKRMGSRCNNLYPNSLRIMNM